MFPRLLSRVLVHSLYGVANVSFHVFNETFSESNQHAKARKEPDRRPDNPAPSLFSRSVPVYLDGRADLSSSSNEIAHFPGVRLHSHAVFSPFPFGVLRAFANT